MQTISFYWECLNSYVLEVKLTLFEVETDPYDSRDRLLPVGPLVVLGWGGRSGRVKT